MKGGRVSYHQKYTDINSEEPPVVLHKPSEDTDQRTQIRGHRQQVGALPLSVRMLKGYYSSIN